LVKNKIFLFLKNKKPGAIDFHIIVFPTYGVHQLSGHWHSSKYLICVQHYRFGTTWGWANRVTRWDWQKFRMGMGRVAY